MANVKTSENCSTILQEVVECEDCSVEVMKFLLDNGAELTHDILNHAVLSKECKIEIIKFLLENGAELPYDVLNNAVKADKCKFEVVRLLIQYGANIDLWVLEDAVANRGGNVEVVKLLLDNGAELPYNILNDAVQSKECNYEVVKLLVENGAELIPRILNEAVRSEGCNFRVVKLLLDRGAQNYITVLRDAVENGKNNFEIVKLLLERKTPSYRNSINTALVHGASVEMIKFLFENGCKITSDTLHFVSGMVGANIKLWKFLIENGAKVRECVLDDVIGNRMYSIEIIKLLLQNVKRLSSRILFPAVFKGKNILFNIQIVKLLLESGVKPDTFTLEYVVKNYDNEIELLKLLLKSSVKVGVNIFKSCTIKSSTIHYFKILLQFMLIQQLKSEIIVMKKSLQYVIFKISNFEHVSLYYEMCIFFDCLIKDLTKMKTDEIHHNFSLFSFISDQCSINPILPLEYNLVNKVLSKFCSGNYICCRDLLYASFSKSDLLHKVCEIDIHVKNNSNKMYSGKKVSLNPDVILYIISFLMEEDVINLVIAFWYEKRNNILKTGFCKSVAK